MALIRCDFFSDVLVLSTSITVILPDAGGDQSSTPPLLYLLHGLTDDDTGWTRNTSIERYAAARGLAVVMPQVHHSFYADEYQGLPFWTFLTTELPRVVHRFFRVSERREETFVAGLSMGGYGAMKWALREPWRFGAAASLSGALGISNRRGPDPWTAAVMDRVFAPGSVTGSDDDPVHLVSTADPAALPPLYVACGTEDHLYGQNQQFVGAARDRGVEMTVDFGTGEHEWGYWDARIQDVLAWLPRAR